LVHAGPGKILCASATQLVIEQLAPQLVIDAGAAGSLSSELPIGSIVCVERSYEYDVCELGRFAGQRDELTAATLLVDMAGRDPGMVTGLLQDLSRAVPGTVVRLGDVASGERNVADPETRNALHDALGALICNWESSAVLRTARASGIGCLSFRAVSDSAGETAAADFRANLDAALEGLTRLLAFFVEQGWPERLLGEVETDSKGQKARPDPS
jgi:adenosylhomocysteine nucleosidase